ncbi:pilus assembly protein [Sphingomonas sp. LT1P40]|uniref:pilus assembly protein n=1 Tax=Alteristakelama amylovorans TaxID=3096166 RepID=UPI002FC59818
MRRHPLSALRDATSGLALIEFALSLPILLILSLTGAEMTNYIITRMRVSQISLHLADNAARIGSGSQLQAKTINEADINDLLTGSGLQGGELDLFTRGRVIVSSLEPVATPNTTNKYRIRWQRCRGAKTTQTSSYGAAGTTNLNGMGRTGRLAVAPEAGVTMYVEVYYEYQPIFSRSLAPNTSFREEASMMVRDRRDTVGGSNGVYPVTGVTASTC